MRRSLLGGGCAAAGQLLQHYKANKDSAVGGLVLPVVLPVVLPAGAGAVERVARSGSGSAVISTGRTRSLQPRWPWQRRGARCAHRLARRSGTSCGSVADQDEAVGPVGAAGSSGSAITGAGAAGRGRGAAALAATALAQRQLELGGATVADDDGDDEDGNPQGAGSGAARGR